MNADLMQQIAPSMKDRLVRDIEIFKEDVKRFKAEVCVFVLFL